MTRKYIQILIKIDWLILKVKAFIFLVKPRQLGIRNSSYPYLSADTYYELSDIKIISHQDIDNYYQISKFKSSVIVYIKSELFKYFLDKIESLIKTKFTEVKLIITEDDVLLNEKSIKNLDNQKYKIFASNCLSSNRKIFPIPLGLERMAYKSSGTIKQFQSKYSTKVSKRPWDVVVCWNDQTNSNRFNLKNKFRDRENILVIDKRISSYTLHKIYRKTLFVPSPAGNGLDCHRTWEALYLGAVPVVLESEFTGDDSWPVVRVNSWEDFLSLKHDELINLYEKNARTQEQMIDFSLNILEKISGKKLRAVI